MNAKRKKVELYILTLMSQLDSTGDNTTHYKAMFKSMSDTKFDVWMKSIRDKKATLFVYMENLKQNISMNDLTALARKRKVKLFERLSLFETSVGRRYLTKTEVMVIKVPIRRLSQYIAHKIALPESDTKINPITGQVIPPDKGSTMSMVETSILVGKGLETTAVELLKVRGGDITAYQSAKHQMEDEGSLSIESLPLENRPRSVVTANVYLNTMGIDTNL